MENKDFVIQYLENEYEKTKDENIVPLLSALKNIDIDILPADYHLMKNGGRKRGVRVSKENERRAEEIKEKNMTDMKEIMDTYGVSYSTAYRLKLMANLVQQRTAPESKKKKKEKEKRPGEITLTMKRRKTSRTFSLSDDAYEHLLEMWEEEDPDNTVSTFLENIIEERYEKKTEGEWEEITDFSADNKGFSVGEYLANGNIKLQTREPSRRGTRKVRR